MTATPRPVRVKFARREFGGYHVNLVTDAGTEVPVGWVVDGSDGGWTAYATTGYTVGTARGQRIGWEANRRGAARELVWAARWGNAYTLNPERVEVFDRYIDHGTRYPEDGTHDEKMAHYAENHRLYDAYRGLAEFVPVIELVDLSDGPEWERLSDQLAGITPEDRELIDAHLAAHR